MLRRPRSSTLFPYTTLFESAVLLADRLAQVVGLRAAEARQHLGDLHRLLLVEDHALRRLRDGAQALRSEEHTSELQSRQYLVCRLLLEKKIYTLRCHVYIAH